MKKTIIAALVAVFTLSANNAMAQTKANAEQRKEQLKEKKLLDQTVLQKAIKEARKEAKKLEKEGFKTPVGKLSLAKQLEKAWECQAETDTEGNPYWYIATVRSIGGTQSAAKVQATALAKIDIAGQIETQVTQLIETKVANDDMGQEEAASLTNTVATSKSLIESSLGRIIPLVEVYRTLPNNNVEVMVTLGYNSQSATKKAIEAIRQKLAERGDKLAEQLDKIVL